MPSPKRRTEFCAPSRYLANAACLLVLLAHAAGCSSGSSQEDVPETPPVPEPGGDSFGVGGTLSGLAAGEVTLQLLAGSVQQMSVGNGSFTFPDPVADGGHYALEIDTMPLDPPQRCDVANGAGRVDGADVTDIEVVCTEAYLISGEVVGLKGSGLELVLRFSGDGVAYSIPETIDASGLFQFDYPLKGGESYSIEITAQPQDPVQKCRIISGEAGVMPERNETDVFVGCGDATVTYTVTGLSGSGLKVALATEVSLNDNPPQMLELETDEVSEDGQQTFAFLLDLGDLYDVRIEQQPAAPVQECLVENGSGVIEGDVTDVMIRCPEPERYYRFDDSVSFKTEEPLHGGEKKGGILDVIYKFPSGPSVALGSISDLGVTDLFETFYHKGAVIHSSRSGMTFWSFAVSPQGLRWPTKDASQGHYVSLDTRWRLRKAESAASLKLEITDVNMLAYDDEHYINATGSLRAYADMHVRAYRVDDFEVAAEPFFNSHGGMALVGRLDDVNPPKTKWELERRIEAGVPSDLWSFDDFVLDPAAGENEYAVDTNGTPYLVFRADQVATARLAGPVLVPIDLSALSVGEEFILVADTWIQAVNNYSPEGGTAVYLRDPGAFEPGEPEGGVTVAEMSGVVMVDIGDVPLDATRASGAAAPDSCTPGAELSMLEFDAAEYRISESPNLPPFASVNVTRSGDLSGYVNARVSLSAGSAGEDEDFVPGDLVVNFGPGSDAPRTLEVPLIDDDVIEADESFTLTLVNPQGCAEIGAQAVAEVTIVDDDNSPGAIAFSTGSYDVDEGAGVATLQLVRSGGTFGNVDVTIESADGSAKGSTDGYGDYNPVITTVTFLDGDGGPQEILVPIVDDLVTEANETVAFTLSATGAETGSPSEAVLTIQDNDQDQADTVQFAFGEFLAIETDGAAPIVVSRYGDVSSAATVTLTSSDGTAIAGDDYEALDITVSFAAGEETKFPEVVILENPQPEPDESVNLELSNPSGAALGSPSSAELIITEDDASNWGQWQPDIEIDAANGNANDAHIVFDNQGNALAVWYQESANGTDIWSNYYSAGTGWEGVDLVEQNDADRYAGSPRVAFIGSGAALAVWTQTDASSGNESAWANIFTAGSGWGVPELIEAEANAVLGNIELAVNEIGDGAAAWVQFDGTNANINVNRFHSGSWTGAAIVDEGDDIVDNPSVVVGSDGSILAAWQQSATGVVKDIRAARLAPGSSDWETVLVSTTNTGAATLPKLGIDENGNALAIWQQNPGFDRALYASRYTPAGGWEQPVMIGPGDGVEQHQLAMGPGGTALAIWRKAVSVSGTVVLSAHVSRFTPGDGWNTQSQAPEAISIADVFYPKVAFNAAGHALAVWFELDLSQPIGSGYSVWSNRYTDGIGWRYPEQVGSSGGQIGTGMPNLGMGPAGEAFAIWTRGGEVRVNRFE